MTNPQTMLHLATRLREAAHYSTEISALEQHCQQIADELEDMSGDTAVHLSHCNQNEYLGSCKYGDDNCPAFAPVGAPREALVRRIELARSFIAKEYSDPTQEPNGDWICPNAKPAHDALCLCLDALASQPTPQAQEPS